MAANYSAKSHECTSLVPHLILILTHRCVDNAILSLFLSFDLGSFLSRSSYAPQPLQYSFRLVGNGIDSRGLIANLVQAGLHSLYELLLGLVRPVLVAGMMYIDKDGFDVFGLLGSAVRVDACDTHEFEEIEQGGFGEALEVEGAVTITVRGRGGITVGIGLEALYPRLFEGWKLVFQLSGQIQSAFRLCTGPIDKL